MCIYITFNRDIAGKVVKEDKKIYDIELPNHLIILNLPKDMCSKSTKKEIKEWLDKRLTWDI